MFGRKPLSLGRVYDTVIIKEGGESLKLHVNADPSRLVVGLSQAQKMLSAINEDTPDDERRNTARFFASVIFGDEQTQKLFDYYFGDASCVIAVSGKYFAERLGKLITKQQKKSLGK